MRKLQSGKFFETGRPHAIAGVVRMNGEFFVVSDVEQSVAVDEYGDEEIGFCFNARPATSGEIQAWKEARRAARGGRTVLEMLDDKPYSIIG